MTYAKPGHYCADVRDNGMHLQPCESDGCPATVHECCEHCLWLRDDR